MPDTGVSIFSGKAFTLQEIQVLYHSNLLFGTYYPKEDRRGNLIYDFTLNENHPEKHVTTISNGIYESSHVQAHVELIPQNMRIILSCNQNHNTVIVRWNRSKDWWSGFQDGWQYKIKRLFVIDKQILQQLLVNNDPWRCPKPGKPGYHPALDESSVIDANGEQDVAMIMAHTTMEDTRKYLIRWEDYVNDDELTWEPETNLANETLLPAYKEFFGLD